MSRKGIWVHMHRCLTFCLGGYMTTLLSINGMNLWVQILDGLPVQTQVWCATWTYTTIQVNQPGFLHLCSLLWGLQEHPANGKYQLKEFMWNWSHPNPGQSLIITASVEVQLRKFTLAIHFIQLFSSFLCTISFSKFPIMHLNHKGSMVNHSNVAQTKPSNSSIFIKNLEDMLSW